MKKLLLIAALAIISQGTKAQTWDLDFSPSFSCDVEIAFVCFECPNTTITTPINWTTYSSSGSLQPITNTIPSCAPDQLGILVRYKDCPSNIIYLIDSPFGVACNPFRPSDGLSACSPCLELNGRVEPADPGPGFILTLN
jgi:hypothetical protein